MARILVVDDAIIMREKLKQILQRNGHHVVGEASDGSEAALMYSKHRPDIVTMDITMPRVDGVEGCRRIRNIDPDATIIVISAMGQKAIILEAIEAGATGFIVKPFETAKVVAVIKDTTEHLEKKGKTLGESRLEKQFGELKKHAQENDALLDAIRK